MFGFASLYRGRRTNCVVKVNQVKIHCQDLALSIINTRIHIYKIFFVHVLWIQFFYVDLNINQKQLKTNDHET